MAGIDDLLGGIMGGGGVDTSRLTALAQPLTDLIASRGGLGSVIGQLQDSSIGSAVTSWIGTGPNEAVTPEQVEEAMPDAVNNLASSSGLSVGDVASSLAQLLPNLVDKVTPGGSIPGVDQIQGILGSLPGAQQVSGLLGGFLGGKG